MMDLVQKPSNLESFLPIERVSVLSLTISSFRHNEEIVYVANVFHLRNYLRISMKYVGIHVIFLLTV
jgi:hypothetical protein